MTMERNHAMPAALLLDVKRIENDVILPRIRHVAVADWRKNELGSSVRK